MAEGAHGRVSFRLSINADGNPDACGILTSSGSQELDSATCDLLLARSHFKPAVGPDGGPVRGSYSSAVLWMIPTGLEPWVSRVAFVRSDLDAKGAVTACTTTGTGAEGFGGCTLFGQAANLARLISTPLNQLREVEVRLIQAASGQPAVPDSAPANAVRSTIAKAVLTIDATGSIANCNDEVVQTFEGRSLGLCAMQSGFSVRFSPAAGAPSRTMQLTFETVAFPR